MIIKQYCKSILFGKNSMSLLRDVESSLGRLKKVVIYGKDSEVNLKELQLKQGQRIHLINIYRHSKNEYKAIINLIQIVKIGC